MPFEILRDFCDNCGYCVSVCPQQIFTWELYQEPVVIINPERLHLCNHCFACMEVCSNNALFYITEEMAKVMYPQSYPEKPERNKEFMDIEEKKEREEKERDSLWKIRKRMMYNIFIILGLLTEEEVEKEEEGLYEKAMERMKERVKDFIVKGIITKEDMEKGPEFVMEKSFQKMRELAKKERKKKRD